MTDHRPDRESKAPGSEPAKDTLSSGEGKSSKEEKELETKIEKELEDGKDTESPSTGIVSKSVDAAIRKKPKLSTDQSTFVGSCWCGAGGAVPSDTPTRVVGRRELASN